MAQLQAFPEINAPLTDVEMEDGTRGSGRMTPAWKYLLQSLWSRTGSAQGVLSADVQDTANSAQTAAAAAQTSANSALTAAGTAQTAAAGAQSDVDALAAIALTSTDAVGGWVAPTGAGSRATFNMNLALPVAATYSQAEVTAIAGQVIVLQKRIGQLELDLLTLGGIKV